MDSLSKLYSEIVNEIDYFQVPSSGMRSIDDCKKAFEEMISALYLGTDST